MLGAERVAEIESLLVHTRPDDEDRDLFAEALAQHFRSLDDAAGLTDRLEAAIAARAGDVCDLYLGMAVDDAGAPRFDLDAKSARGFKAPMTVLAAQAGLGHVTARLVAMGANPARGNARGENAVHALARAGQHEALAVVLGSLPEERLRGLINFKTQILQWTALHAAAQSAVGAPETIAVLLAHGARITSESASRSYPLHFAVSAGVVDAVSALLEYEPDEQLAMRDKSGSTPLMVGVQAGRVDCVARICGAMTSQPQDKARRIASEGGAHEALRDAVERGDVRLVDLLIHLLQRTSRTPDEPVASARLLHRAAQLGSRDVVHRLIDAGAPLEAVNENGETALILATRNGHTETVRLLFTVAARLPVRTESERGPRVTALHHAVYHGHRAIIDILLADREAANAADERSFSPLHIAAMTGRADIAAQLLALADPNGMTDTRRTPLHLAARYGHLAVVDVLLRRDDIDLAARNVFGQTALHFAAYHGHTEIVRRLASRMTFAQILLLDGTGDDAPLDIGEGEDTDGARRPERRRTVSGEEPAQAPARGRTRNSALTTAIRAGHAEAAGILVNALNAQSGSEPGATLDAIEAQLAATDAGGRTLLHSAAIAGAGAIADMLLARKPELIEAHDDQGRTPLLAVIHARNTADEKDEGTGADAAVEMVDLLLAHGARTNPTDDVGASALHLAAASGEVRIVQRLLEHLAASGRDVAEGINLRTKSTKRTPLHEAAGNGHAAIVRLLLDHGADPSIPSAEQRTALHVASFGGSLATVEALLDHGGSRWASLVTDAAPESRDVYAKTPLHYAAECRADAAPIIKAMVAAGASLTARNRDDQGTPLHVAAIRGNAEAVRALLEADHDRSVLNAPQGDGSTPLMLACWGGHLDVVRLLIERGANVNATGRGNTTALIALVKSLDPDFESSRRRRESEATGERPEIARLLLAAGARIDPTLGLDEHAARSLALMLKDNPKIGDTAAHLAIRFRLDDIAEVLIDHPEVKTARGPRQATLLHYAAKFANTALAARLLTLGFSANDVDADGRTALHFAAYNASEAGLQCVGLLLRHGAEPLQFDRLGRAPAHYAVLNGHASTLRLLLHAAPAASLAVDAAGLTPSHIAIEMREDAAPLAGLSPQNLRLATPNEGHEPVPHAAIRKLEEHVRGGNAASIARHTHMLRAVIVLPGARKVADKAGRRPLHFAALNGATTSMRVLLETSSNRDLNQGDLQGCKPLHLACEVGATGIAMLLLDHGADPNAKASDVVTPLHMAALRGDAMLIARLLEAGARADTVNHAGKTARELALEHGHDHCLALLDAAASPSLDARHALR